MTLLGSGWGMAADSMRSSGRIPKSRVMFSGLALLMIEGERYGYKESQIH
jgi:hypothetical protein